MARNEFSTVKDIITDFKGRRASLIKAFTTGKEKLCLFEFPNKTWDVMPPVEMLPSNLPKPIIGINLAKDRMQENEWLSKVAILSDLWLLSIAFCYAAVSKFGKSERNRLFQMINDLPTIAEIVTEAVEPAKDVAAISASAAGHENSSKNRSRGKTSLQLRPPEKAIKMFTSNKRRGKK